MVFSVLLKNIEEMKIEIAALKDQLEPKRKKKAMIEGVGLINNNNICYMNAIIQVLNCIKPFADVLIDKFDVEIELDENYVSLELRKVRKYCAILLFPQNKMKL